MSLYPSFGVPVSSQLLEPITRDLFDFDVAGATWDPSAGTFSTPSGHVGTFSRGASLASVSDALGATYTALNAQPAFEQRDLNGDGTYDAFGLRMGTSDRLAFPCNVLPMAHAGFLEFVETGALATSGATLWALLNAGATGAGLWIDSSGTFYRFNYSDGTTVNTATLAIDAPTSGDRVRLFWELTAAGALTFWQSINDRPESVATASALTLPAAWASSASFRFNSRGTSANPAQMWLRRCRIMAGALDMFAIQERR